MPFNIKKIKIGNIYHQIFELISSNLADNIDFIIKEFLNEFDLSKNQQNEIYKKITTLINKKEFQFIFNNPNSYSEVPIIGQVDQKKISAQIDKMIILENEIHIIDFKISLKSQKQGQIYFNQLSLYKKLVQKIYPDATIKVAILWVIDEDLQYL